MANFCPACGSGTVGAQYCSSCGLALEAPVLSAVPEPQPVDTTAQGPLSRRVVGLALSGVGLAVATIVYFTLPMFTSGDLSRTLVSLLADEILSPLPSIVTALCLGFLLSALLLRLRGGRVLPVVLATLGWLPLPWMTWLVFNPELSNLRPGLGMPAMTIAGLLVVAGVSLIPARGRRRKTAGHG